jgi:hydroxyacylglutathione hydrolase
MNGVTNLMLTFPKKADVLVTQSPHIFIAVIPVGPLKCNCTLVANSQTREAVIIDPGGDAQILLDWLTRNQLTLNAVYHSHAHFDHFLASEALRQATGAPLYLHKADVFLWNKLETQCEFFGMPSLFVPTAPPDATMEEGMTLNIQGLGMHHTLFTPGHTPGSCCFHLEDHQLLIAGDTLFQGGIGRTDLWGGSHTDIERSLHQRLFVLDGETLVVTGHGPLTEIYCEKKRHA